MRIGGTTFFEHRPGFIKNTLLKKLFSRPKDAAHFQRTSDEAPLLHAEGARGNDRLRVQRSTSPQEGGSARCADGNGANDMHQSGIDSGKAVLWPPHLRAGISRHLSANGQGELLDAVINTGYGRTLGPSPRYDTWLELPVHQRMLFLASPGRARSVLEEAIKHPAPAHAALIAASLAPDLPTRDLQLQALELVAVRLDALRQTTPLPDAYGMVLAKTAHALSSENTDGFAKEQALLIVENHLHRLQDTQLCAILDKLCGLSRHATFSLRMDVLDILETQLGRVPASRLPLMLGNMATLLDTSAPRRNPADNTRLQQRMLALLQRRLPELAAPAGQGPLLCALAHAGWLCPEMKDAFQGWLSHAAPHLSSALHGRIAASLVVRFAERYGGNALTQSNGMNLLEAHVGKADAEQRGRVLECLPDLLTDRSGNMAETKARALALFVREWSAGAVERRLQALANLGDVLGFELANAPQLVAPVFRFMISNVPDELATLGPQREQGAKVVTAITRSLATIDPADQPSALDFVERRLSGLPPLFLREALYTLVDTGLSIASIRDRASRTFDAWLPAALETANADRFCTILLTSANFRDIPPQSQQRIVETMIVSLTFRAPREREAGLKTMLTLLAPGIDSSLQNKARLMVALCLDDLPVAAKGRLVEEVTRRLPGLDPTQALRCLDMLSSHWRSLRADPFLSLGRSLRKVCGVLAAPASSPELKRRAMATLTSSVGMLVSPGDRDFLPEIASVLMRTLPTASAEEQLAEDMLDVIADCVARCERGPVECTDLLLAYRTLPMAHPHRQAVREILTQLLPRPDVIY